MNAAELEGVALQIIVLYAEVIDIKICVTLMYELLLWRILGLD